MSIAGCNRRCADDGTDGLPIWTSDTGGYRQAPKPRVFARWTQFSAFCPLMIVGGKSHREPWHFPDEIESIFRRYAQLHAALLPYIKLSAKDAHDTGTPIIRPLFLEFPNDAQARKQDYQYMFGGDLMVAPVYTNDDFRRVYSPPGDWMDFDTLEIHTSPKTIERYKAPLARIPVFIRISREVSTRLFTPLFNEHWNGFKKRCDYYLEIRGKFLRPQPVDRMKKKLDVIKSVRPGDNELSRRSIDDSAALVDQESEGSMPYFIAKNLRERIWTKVRTYLSRGIHTKFETVAGSPREQ